MKFPKRDLIRVQSDARSGLGVRFKIRIERHPANPNPAAAPYTSASNPPDPSTDILVFGAGLFEETKDQVNQEDSGETRARRGKIDCHIRYESSFRKAYAVEIGRQRGVWEVLGVDADFPGTAITVYVQSRI